MIVKFNKNQIKALKSIHSKAELIYQKQRARFPALYDEDSHSHDVAFFSLGVIDAIIELGEIVLDD